MHTKIEYLYRDAGNNKQYETVIVSGKVTMRQLEPYLEVDNLLIPGDVGLPELQQRFADFAAYPSDDDHPWHELTSCKKTSEEPSIELSAEELLANFKIAANSGWDEEAAMERLGLLEYEYAC